MNLHKNTAFLRFFFTQFLGALNDNLMRSALIVYLTFVVATEQTWNSGILTNVALLLFILPFFLFSGWAGHLTDSRDKSLLTKRIKQVEIFIVAFAGIAFWLQSLWLLYLLLFCMGTQSSFFGPIKYGILPRLLAKENLLIGNSYLESSTFFAILTGTLMGSYLIGIDYGIPIVSALMLSISLLGYISCLHLPKLPPKTSVSTPGLPLISVSAQRTQQQSSLLSRFIYQQRQLLRFAYTYATPNPSASASYTPARRKRLLWWICLSISWFWLVGSVFISQLPVVVKDVLVAEVSLANVFLVLFTLGIGLGAMLTKKLVDYKSTAKNQIRLWLAPWGHLGMGIGTFLFTIGVFFHSGQQADSPYSPESTGDQMKVEDFFSDPWAWLISSALLMIAFFAGIYAVPLYTELISLVRKEHCGRIVAANNLCNAFFMVCGSLLTIALLGLEFSSLHAIFFIAGVLNLTLVFLSHRKFRLG